MDFYIKEKVNSKLFNELRKLDLNEKKQRFYREIDLNKLAKLKSYIDNSKKEAIKEFIKDKNSFLTMAEQISLYIYFYYIENNYQKTLAKNIPNLLKGIENHCLKIGKLKEEGASIKLIKFELINLFNENLRLGFDYIRPMDLQNIINSNNFVVTDDVLKTCKIISPNIKAVNLIYNYIYLSKKQDSTKYIEDLKVLINGNLFSLEEQYYLLKYFIAKTDRRIDELKFLNQNIFTLVKNEYLRDLENFYFPKSINILSAVDTYTQKECSRTFNQDEPRFFIIRDIISSQNNILLNILQIELNYNDQMLLLYDYCTGNTKNNIFPYLSLLSQNGVSYIEEASKENDKKLNEFLLVNLMRSERDMGKLNLNSFCLFLNEQKVEIHPYIYQSITYSEKETNKRKFYLSLQEQIERLKHLDNNLYQNRNIQLFLIPEKYINLMMFAQNLNQIIKAIQKAYLSNNLDKLTFLLKKDSNLLVMYDLKTEGIDLSDNILIGFGVMKFLDFVGPYIPEEYFPSFRFSKAIILLEIYLAVSLNQFFMFSNDYADVAGAYLFTHSLIFTSRMITLEIYKENDISSKTIEELPQYCITMSAISYLPSLIGQCFISYYTAKEKIDPIARLIPITINHLVNMGVSVSYCYGNYKILLQDNQKYLLDGLIAKTMDIMAFIVFSKYSDLAFTSLGNSVYSLSTLAANGVVAYSLIDPLTRIILDYVPGEYKEHGDNFLSGVSEFYESFSITNFF